MNGLISGGVYDCCLALGFEKMEKGSLTLKFPDRTQPLDLIFNKTSELMPEDKSNGPFAPKIFGNAGIEHMRKYGTKDIHFAKIGEKNHRHSANNPYSQFKDIHTLEKIMKSK